MVSTPFKPGQTDVHQHQVRPMLLAELDGVGPVFGLARRREIHSPRLKMALMPSRMIL